MDPLLEILKIAIPFLLGGAGTWLAQHLKPSTEKQKDNIAIKREEWDLWRDHMAWAKTEIGELRTTVTLQHQKINRLEQRLARALISYADLQSYTHSLVRYVRALIDAVAHEANAAIIFARVVVALPDLDNVPNPIAFSTEPEEQGAHTAPSPN